MTLLSPTQSPQTLPHTQEFPPPTLTSPEWPPAPFFHLDPICQAEICARQSETLTQSVLKEPGVGDSATQVPPIRLQAGFPTTTRHLLLKPSWEPRVLSTEERQLPRTPLPPSEKADPLEGGCDWPDTTLPEAPKKDTCWWGTAAIPRTLSLALSSPRQDGSASSTQENASSRGPSLLCPLSGPTQQKNRWGGVGGWDVSRSSSIRGETACCDSWGWVRSPPSRH